MQYVGLRGGYLCLVEAHYRPTKYFQSHKLSQYMQVMLLKPLARVLVRLQEKQRTSKHLFIIQFFQILSLTTF